MQEGQHLPWCSGGVSNSSEFLDLQEGSAHEEEDHDNSSTLVPEHGLPSLQDARAPENPENFFSAYRVPASKQRVVSLSQILAWCPNLFTLFFLVFSLSAELCLKLACAFAWSRLGL